MNQKDFYGKLDETAAKDTQAAKEAQAQKLQADNAKAIVDTIGAATKALIAFHKNHKPTISVETPDMQGIIDQLKAVEKEIANNKPNDSKVVAGLNKLAVAVSKLPTKFPELTPVETVTVKNQPDYTPQFEALNSSIKSIDAKTTVNVPEDDYTPIIEPLNAVLEAVKAIKIPEVPETDLTPLLQATNSVQSAIEGLRFPVPNYVLPFKDVDGKAVQVQLDASGSLPIAGGAGGGGTQYAEGATTAPATGNAFLARYKATPPSLTDGQLYTPQLDSAGNLKVTGSLSVGGTTDNSAYTAGTSTGTPSMAFYHSTIDTVTDGRAATLGMTSKRALFTNLQNSSGTEVGTSGAPLRIDPTGTTPQPVTGTFWQATQPISAAVLPLPSGAATSAKQPALGTAGTASADVITVQGIASMTALKVDGSAVTQPVSGTFWQATQPVSAASLPLPSGASTSAKQPALGTAGTASADVITVQGIASMTALKVDGSATTQPVSGTITANIGTTNGLALDATLTGGTQKSILRGGAKGSTTAADVTSTASGANHQLVDIAIYDNAGNQITSFGGGTQYADGVARGTATGTLLMVDDGTNIQSALGTTAGVLKVDLSSTTANSTAIKVDGSAVTQPVSGTFWQATQPISAASLPLPTGAAQDATLTGGTQQTKITDGTNVATVKAASTAAVATDKAVVVAVSPNNSVAVTGTFWQATQPVSLATNTPTLQAGSTTAVTQATAANLNATVVGTGTFAVQADNTKIGGNTISAGNGTSGTGVQRVTIASDSTGQIAPAANASATGTSIYNNTALSSTKQAVNASTGNLYGYHIYNPNTVVIYVQLFNVASASVTVGTTAPTAVLAVPPGGWADAPPSGPPIAFATALTIAATTTATGSGAPTTALLANFWYK